MEWVKLGNCTIIDYLKKAMDIVPNKTAYIFYDSKEGRNISITFKDVYDGATSYALYLKEQGLKKNDRVIILAEQKSETIYSIYGTLMAGGVFILVPNPVDQGKYKRLLYTLKSSTAKFIIYNGQGISKIKEEVKVHFINVENIEIKEEQYVDIEITENDMACLQYTSGSINEPKGIIWTHKNIVYSMNTLCEYNLEKDTFVTWLPFFHSMGLCTGVLLNMYLNSTNVILDTQDFVKNPILWLEKISEYKSSMVWAPNSAYLTCISLLEGDDNVKLDLSSIKYMISCSENIRSIDWDNIASCFIKYGLSEKALCSVYGLSEATGALSGGKFCTKELDSDKLQENKAEEANLRSHNTKLLSSVGHIAQNVNVKIVNYNTFTECKENEVGEIWAQGNNISYGYWDNVQATEETFKGVLP